MERLMTLSDFANISRALSCTDEHSDKVGIIMDMKRMKEGNKCYGLRRGMRAGIWTEAVGQLSFVSLPLYRLYRINQ